MRRLLLAIIIISSYSAQCQRHLSKLVLLDNLEKVQNSINDGADVNEQGRKYCSPLMTAVLNGNPEMVRLLLKNGAKPEPCHEQHSGSYLNNTAFAHSPLISDQKTILYSPLYYAIRYPNIEIIKAFKEYGYDFSAKMGGDVFTYPIVAAAEYNDTAIVNLLVGLGSDVTKKDSEGKTALMYSVSANNFSLTKKLFQLGCPVNDTSGSGYTPLMYAADNLEYNADIIYFLISNGVNCNYVNVLNQSAFSLACGNNYRSLVFYLLDHGAQITENDYESTARMYHYSADYYLVKNDLVKSRAYYLKARQFYDQMISVERDNISKVNSKKAAEIIGTIFVEMTCAVLAYKLDGQLLNLKDRKSVFRLGTFNYALLDCLYSINDEFIFQNFRLSADAGYDEQKDFYKEKIRQFEMATTKIDNIVSCIDNGLTGQELTGCLKENQLNKK